MFLGLASLFANIKVIAIFTIFPLIVIWAAHYHYYFLYNYGIYSSIFNNAFKVHLVIEGLKFYEDLAGFQSHTKLHTIEGQDDLALIGMLVGYLEKDQKKLKDVSDAGLTDVFMWERQMLEP